MQEGLLPARVAEFYVDAPAERAFRRTPRAIDLSIKQRIGLARQPDELLGAIIPDKIRFGLFLMVA